MVYYCLYGDSLFTGDALIHQVMFFNLCFKQNCYSIYILGLPFVLETYSWFLERANPSMSFGLPLFSYFLKKTFYSF